jgi:ABC-type multidrug transport system ATPase subunit/ABC-type multidrug transport system permease subunit
MIVGMPPENSYAIQTFNLTKRFPEGERLMGLLPSRIFGPPAVDGLNLAIHAGELFGLLGPNGAGKTTLVKMLATLVEPTSGDAVVCGYDLGDHAAVKASIGLVTTDERSFFWRLSGRQNLAFFSALHGLRDPARVDETLEQVGLEAVADRRFKEYSTGMRQRLAIARALLHRPSVLFLDEPTRGLDPPAIRSLHKLIRGELTTGQGLTVLMTTHWLQEAESLCDRIAIMHRGRIRGIGTVDDLRVRIGVTGTYTVRVSARAGSDGWLPPWVTVETPETVVFPDDGAMLGKFLEAAAAAGERIETIEHDEVRLETIFDRLVEDGEPDERVPVSTPHVRLRAGARPGRPSSALQVAAAFLRRDWQTERSYRLAFLLSFGGIFFSAAVFYFVAQLIDAAAEPYLRAYGGSYFAFVLVGIALQRYFGVGLNAFASAFRQAQTTGTLEAMLTTPAPPWMIALSSSMWSYGLVSLQVLLYLLIGVVLLGVRVQVNVPALALAAVLGVISFAALGVLSASFVMVLKRGDPITWVVGAVSTFFGGVYFPVELLPIWLQPVSAVLPVTYGLRAVRLSVLQGAGIAEISGDLLAMALFCVILLPLGLAAFRYAMYRARVDGSLTHY